MPAKAISKAKQARIARGKLPIKRMIAGQVVTLYVGGAVKPYALHKDLLVNTSTYFRKAFTGCFKEKDGEIVLDDIIERTLDVLKRWLYAQKLAKPKTLRDRYKVRVRFIDGIDANQLPVCGYASLEDFDDRAMAVTLKAMSQNGWSLDTRIVYLRGRFEAFDHQTLKFWHWDDLVDVYIMADKYNFPHLRDEVIKQWQYQAANFRSHCTIETVARAFQNLPEKSNLLSLIMDHWAFLWQPQPRDIRAMQMKACISFLARLALAQAVHKGSTFAKMRHEFTKAPRSQHEHVGEDHSCSGFERYSYSNRVRVSSVWQNGIFTDERPDNVNTKASTLTKPKQWAKRSLHNLVGV
ncbi:hypothetical protein FKW77_004662 [Venturia effusa]|uniref:BTB domain-containing protein n=1 Tax=Venturia effusa TaxID=50376 RepID=A0A517L373_9PEZI|nr:hypothetical protein FKW77_004662 [Venturia effusa]